MKTPLTAKCLGAPKILLVDDNRNGLIVRKALLEEIGCVVQTAGNGEDGLALYVEGLFDVVVTDERMPGMNGTELILIIRRQNPNARIILLSGFVDQLGLTEESTGADVVLTKNANEAKQLIRSVLRMVNLATRKPPASQKTLLDTSIKTAAV